MKQIILTCDDGEHKPTRFLIEIDELTGDAQIVKEHAARVDRDRSTFLSLRTEHTPPDAFPGITLTVEAA